MPRLDNPALFGDLYVEFEVVFPKAGEIKPDVLKKLFAILPQPDTPMEEVV